jgi:hypothetical protein
VHWHTLGSIGGCKGGLLVKGINARAALISLFLGLATVTSGQAEEYYVYQTPNGALVISNKEPAAGSKIIKQINLSENPQAEEPGKLIGAFDEN